MGIPVICNKNVGDLNSQSEKYSDYILALDLSEDDYDRAILKVNNLMQMRATHHHEIRDVGKKYFSLEAGVEKYAQIYKELLPDN